MKRNAVLGAILLATALTTGCVDRKFVITSDPPNAAVYRNGMYIGQTPVDDPFLYYGKYEFKIVKDGYETVVEQKKITAPWYEIPPIDFVTDVFLPYEIRDVRRIHYVLPERGPNRELDVLERAQMLQNRANAIGAANVDGNRPSPMRRPDPAAPPSTPTVAPAPAVFPGSR